MSTGRFAPPMVSHLVRAHRVITRGLNVALESGPTLLALGPGDLTLYQGYVDYVHTLAVVFGNHYAIEEQTLYSEYRTLLPLVPFDRLADDHAAVDELLRQTFQGLPHVHTSGGRNLRAVLAPVLAPLGRLRDLWEPHIAIEESRFPIEAQDGGGALDWLLPAEWHADSEPDPDAPLSLAVPFMLYNLRGDDRAIVAAAFSAKVREYLDGAWAEAWRPMRPFLLMDMA